MTRTQPPSERIRRPQPLLRRRVPTGRGALEQANATDDTARLTLRFWFCLLLSAVAAGLLGASMVGVLRLVQHSAYGYHGGPFGQAVTSAGPLHRLVVLAVAGLVLGPAWWLLRRHRWSGTTDLDDVLWSRSGRLSLRRSLLTGTLSEMAVGAGASIGREAAPKLLGGAVSGRLATLMKLDPEQQRLLTACGSGAGLGCVYNVPLAGALLAAEVLLGELSLPIVLPALIGSTVATAVSWPLLGTGPVYPGLQAAPLTAATLGIAAVLGPLFGVAAVGIVRLIGRATHHQARGRGLLVAPLLSFSLLGALAVPLPLLLGNGKDIARTALLGGHGQTVLTLVALAALKPVVTAACLGSGANGGLLTPVIATGAAGGAAIGTALHQAWPHAPTTGTCALLGAAALTSAATQAPLTAVALVLELTRTQTGLVAPVILAAALACLVTRQLDGYSIYSARLTARTGEPALLR